MGGLGEDLFWYRRGVDEAEWFGMGVIVKSFDCAKIYPKNRRGITLPGLTTTLRNVSP